MDAGDPQVQPREELVGLVEPAVVEDVDLDPLEQGEAGATEVLVDGVDDVELAGRPLGAQAPGDGQPGVIAEIPRDQLQRMVKDLESQMKTAARELEFEKAALLRDQIVELRRILEVDPVAS